MVHRVGIIGVGGIAGSHVIGYHQAGVEIVAIADVDTGTLERRQHEWNVPRAFTRFEDLLAEGDIDAVSVCTPNASHHAATVAAAKAGKHVLCEKPISLSLEQAQEMIDACANAGVVLQVGHHLRSMVAVVRARAMIDDGAIGRVTYVRARQAHDWGGARTVRTSFGSRANSGGGTLLDNGCHLFDLSRYLGGDVDDVFARIATLKFEVEVEDTATASLGFSSGALGQVEVAWTGTGWQEAFWVFGTEGSLEYDNRVGSMSLVHRYRGSTETTWAGTDLATYELQGNEAHTRHVGNFIAAIDGRGPVVCTGEDGLEAVRLVLASYESAATGAPVRIDGR